MTAGRWITALAATVALAGVTPAVLADTKTVKLEGLTFKPKEIKIDVEDTVKWEYVSGGNHTVTFDDGSYDSNPSCGTTGALQINCFKQGDEPKRRTFETAGRFPYYCRVHGGPGGQGMSGVVEVEGGSTDTGGSSPSSGPATSATGSTAATTESTTDTTAAPTTTTTRQLATSSSLIQSTTTTGATGATFAPAEAPALAPESPSVEPEDTPETVQTEAAGSEGDGGGSSSAVPVIVGLLLAASAAGGALLWRLRPGRGGPKPKP